MSPEHSDFSDLNLLGADFCSLPGVYIAYDYRNRQVKLFFRGEQELPPKS